MAATKQPASVHQLKVTLRDIRPPIWRRVQVSSNISLAALHDVLQVVMGWENAHLHQFEVGGAHFSDPEFGLKEIEAKERARLERQAQPLLFREQDA